jgi:phosphinothricin acetyltransferase
MLIPLKRNSITSIKMKIEFKNASKEDLPRIVGTYNASIPDRLATADLEPVSVASKEAWFNQHNATTRPLLLVMADGKYAGWISFNNFYGRPAYDKTAELSIYLEPDLQSKGLGSACLEYALKLCPSLHIATLLGFIFGHNEPSLKLFYRHGFEKWAYLPAIADMDGVLRDLIIVGKKI